MNDYNNRFIRNIGSITQQEQEILSSKTVLVLGCGGLGGYVIEELTRLGVSNIIAFDGDVFDVSNLNRQIGATSSTLHHFKAQSLKNRMLEINEDLSFEAKDKYFNPKEDLEYLTRCDVVVDCLDNVASKKILFQLASELNKPLVYGSVASYQGQVSTIFPNSKSLPILYDEKAMNFAASSLSFMVAMIASIEVSEVLKVLLNKEPNLIDKMLIVDGESLEFHIVNLSIN